MAALNQLFHFDLLVFSQLQQPQPPNRHRIQPARYCSGMLTSHDPASLFRMARYVDEYHRGGFSLYKLSLAEDSV